MVTQKDLEFNRTASVIAFLGKCMSDIHEMYPAKEDRKIREQLLQPYRDCCMKIHYERIRLNREA